MRESESVGKAGHIPCISVLAGTNGAGKSSILGEMLARQGSEYFNPDTATQQILAANPGIPLETANSEAWRMGKRLLEKAISARIDFAFETTLGGSSITGLLERALSEGLEVRVWYVGLNSPEQHLRRVRSRVRHGGHDIPEQRIRERYLQSRMNLIRLLPKLTELHVYDNSAEADPHEGRAPEPRLLLHCLGGMVERSCDLTHVPEWAKSIVATAAFPKSR